MDTMKKLLAILLLSSAAFAQMPDAPRPKPFLGKRNVLLITSVAASIAADGYSTQHFLAFGKYRELNPVAAPFVRSRQGTAGYFAVGFAATVGTMYIAHRKGWRKLEWIIPVTVTAAETAWAIHNQRMNIHRAW